MNNILIDNIKAHMCEGNERICHYLIERITDARLQSEEELRNYEVSHFPDGATDAEKAWNICAGHLVDIVWLERATQNAIWFLNKFEKGLSKAFHDRDYRMAVYYAAVFCILKGYEYWPIFGLYSLILADATWDLQQWPQFAYQHEYEEEW